MGMRQRKLAGLFTYFIIVVAFLDTMTLLPILSPFVVSLGAGAVYTGVILGSYSLVNMVGNIAAGPIIDIYGRRRTIIFGMAVAGISVGAYSLVSHPWHLFGFRVIHGIGGAVLIPAIFAYVGDRTKSSSVGRSMGYTGATIAVASLIGPALGGIGSANLGPRWVFALLGILLCVTAGITAFTLHAESEAPFMPRPNKAAFLSAVRGKLSFALAHSSLREAYCLIFTLTFAMGTLAFGLPLTMQEAGFSAAHTGAFFGIYAGGAFLVFALPSNRLPDVLGRRQVALAGSLSVASALLILSFFSSALPLVAGMILFGIGFGTMFPAAGAMIVDHTTKEERGSAFGIFHAVFSLGAFAGPIAAGVLAKAGTRPFWASIGVFLITGSIYTVKYINSSS